jgi:hypothetical protein
MDCKTARLLLLFHRPRADELADDEAQALEAHLAVCADCDSAARAEKRLDAHLGKAMRAVEVPDGLRTELLHRLAAERGDWYRRWMARATWVGGVAAAILLLVGGVYFLREAIRPEVDTEAVFLATNVSNQGREEVEESLKALGIRAEAPRLNYAFFNPPAAVCELPGQAGKKVGYLQFFQLSPPKANGKDKKVEVKRAKVFIVDDRQFNLKALQPPSSDEGYTYRLDVKKSRSGRYAYLIFYTGDNYNWLRDPDEEE